MTLTRRETHALAAFVLLLISTFIIPQRILDNFELAYLLLVVVPLGLYIATDPGRVAQIEALYTQLPPQDQQELLDLARSRARTGKEPPAEPDPPQAGK